MNHFLVDNLRIIKMWSIAKDLFDLSSYFRNQNDICLQGTCTYITNLLPMVWHRPTDSTYLGNLIMYVRYGRSISVVTRQATTALEATTENVNSSTVWLGERTSFRTVCPSRYVLRTSPWSERTLYLLN